MKKTNKTRILAVTLSLIVILALSASAFAEGPQGGFGQGQQMSAPQSGFGQDWQMGNAPQGGMQQGGPQDSFRQGRQTGDLGRGMQTGAPQGGFGLNDGQQPPEKPEGEEDRMPPSDVENGCSRNERMSGQEPPEMPEGDEPPVDGQVPPEMPEGTEPPADGQEPPEKPEGDEDRTPPSDGQQLPEKPAGDASTDVQQLSEDDQNLFFLFRQFLEWLKNNSEKQ